MQTFINRCFFQRAMATIEHDLKMILTPKNLEEAYAVASGQQELDVGSQLYQELYSYYLSNHHERAPYETWKMRHDSGPDIDTLISEWLAEDLAEK